MTTEIRVPVLGESVVEATVGQWFKQAGEAVSVDEPLVELETDKVTVEVPAPVSGVLADIVVNPGDTVAVGALLGVITKGEGKPGEAAASPAPTPTPASPPKVELEQIAREPHILEEVTDDDMPPSPAARKLLAESGLERGDVKGSGRRGQVLKGDVTAQAAEALLTRERKPKPAAPPRAPVAPDDEAREERVRMTRLRQTIAKRLKEAQDTAAMLTTFNEVDMSAVIEMRKNYKDAFEKKHGVKLGFMGFFVKACVQALKDIPALNAEIDGNDIVYKNYYHIGVAVSTERGLVVPVIRNADAMSLAEIEGTITDFGVRARDGKLGLNEMQGGTFTISNGGVYGSMLSTPILNAPQSGILGMHRIEERAVVRNGQIVARPMMYLALSYDHRLVDGKDAVTFLVNLKESLEAPERLVLHL
ncbi:MAG: 2-oxoglutarate dehydrogenase complex dihydrolipoyllysine-residue succinyltransferase [Hyphomicrobiaceae bacterium]|nr:2-oxoglutarate dehydrogenase complex dihydrolipoyllysine-residue succinyltransferase [Hyphomicrobiaceae bacterium]MDX2450931.1 2-oxoglutarate dehydrogenase complex dihydrolipoyllysine-residue succinyltransferase [Hyphomicrobiaceae bacterium]